MEGREPTSAPDRIRARVLEEIETRKDDLFALSLGIHDRPELAYEEHAASRDLARYLSDAGFRVTYPYRRIETAYRGDVGSTVGTPVVAILAEYDALPAIGHGCGHNLIAMMGTAAAVGLASVADQFAGRIAAIGTPAEEGGGGKIALIKAGGFDDVDVAMMVHPSSRTMATRATLAADRVDVEFFGRAAHAAAQPHEGINALDGLLQLFSAVHALRLVLRPDARVHGIITHGGTAANVIPDYAAGKFSVRALDRRYQQEVLERFVACAEGAARATATRVKINVSDNAGYANLVPSTALANTWKSHISGFGRAVEEPLPGEGLGSTDMGNVSQILPSIQPYVAIGPISLAYHSIEFREAARSSQAHEAALDAAKAMALTALAVITDRALLREARDEFAARRRRGDVTGRL